MMGETEDHGMEINEVGHSEDQLCCSDVQSADFSNFADGPNEGIYREDQEDLPKAKRSEGRGPKILRGGAEAVQSEGISAAGAVGFSAAVAVALIVAAAVIVPSVTGEGTDVDFFCVVSGSSEIDYEIIISDFEGDGLCIVLMDGISEVYRADAANGLSSGSITGLRSGTVYSLEVRSGTPALHLIDGMEISTLDRVPHTVSAELYHVEAGFSTVRYIVTLNDFTESTDVRVELRDGNGGLISLSSAGALTVKGMVSGLSPNTSYSLVALDGEDNHIGDWAVVTREMPAGTFSIITNGTDYVTYGAVVDGFRQGDDITVTLTDVLTSETVDTFRVTSGEFTNTVTGLSPGTSYVLGMYCEGNPISGGMPFDTQTP